MRSMNNFSEEKKDQAKHNLNENEPSGNRIPERSINQPTYSRNLFNALIAENVFDKGVI